MLMLLQSGLLITKMLENSMNHLRVVYFKHQERLCGVSQGLILSPLLFFIYINDFAMTCNYLFFRLFADDTNLTASHKDLKTSI